MRYVVRRSVIQLIGHIWMPAAVCAQEKELTSYDLGNIEAPITRDTVEHWLMLNSGDFQDIIDFRASLEVGPATVEIPWAKEESALTFNDCLYGSEEGE